MSEAKWLTKLSVEELRGRILKKPYKPFEIDGVPVFINVEKELLPDEVFKKHPELPVEASNLGRIRHNGRILLQQPDESKPETDPYGYLRVEIPDVSKYQLVYRLVAETWCENPDKNLYNTVHHISNNGMDNRASNLLWVTKEQHGAIHFNCKENNK